MYTGSADRTARAWDALGLLRWCAGQLSHCESGGFEPRNQHNALGVVLLWRWWGCYPRDSSPI